MLAIDVKRGVEATLERVYLNTGRKFKRLSFAWAGNTAAVCHEDGETRVVFPGIDETKQVDRSMFNELIGYALHELGHVWFTDNDPWDRARNLHPPFVSALINGLEDPRIEQRVIKSGYAPNSRALFEFLVNAVLTKDGYVDADDFKNIPYVLAIEGRRLNGYHIGVASVIDDAPWGEHLRWALDESQKAADTSEVVDIAVELYKRLQKLKEEQQQQSEQPKQGDQQDDSQDGDGEGQGQGGEGDTDDSDASDGDGEPNGGESDGDSDKGKPSSGKSFDESGGRPVEPSDYINERLSEVKATADADSPRPHVLKSKVVRFVFE